MTLKKRLLLLIASIGIALASLVWLAGPSEAADPSVIICNSSLSSDSINAYNTSAAVSVFISPGSSCRTISDKGGNARVDVDPSGGSADIDSWKKWAPGASGSAVCVNNEDGASNPYSGSTAQTKTTTYRTYENSNCLG